MPEIMPHSDGIMAGLVSIYFDVLCCWKNQIIGPQKTMLDKIIKGLLQLILAGGLLCAGFFALLHIMKPSTATITPVDTKLACSDNARNFMGSLKDGVDIKGYWKPESQIKFLYSVNDFRLISDGRYVNFKLVFYTFEVNSSTQAGIPIRKRWDVVMDADANNSEGKKCAIVNIRDSEGDDPVVSGSDMKTYFIPPFTPTNTETQPQADPDDRHSEQATSENTSATSETHDTVQYDQNKKMKQEMLSRAMGEASLCAHNMVASRLQVGIRSRQKITDEALEVCARGLVLKTQLFGLPLTPEQIMVIVKTDINREIDAAEEN
jgi:hypothetical protein